MKLKLTIVLTLMHFVTFASIETTEKAVCNTQYKINEDSFYKSLNLNELSSNIFITKWNMTSRMKERLSILNNLDHDLWFDIYDEADAMANEIFNSESGSSVVSTDDQGLLVKKQFKVGSEDISVFVSSSPFVSKKNDVKKEQAQVQMIAVSENGETKRYKTVKDYILSKTSCYKDLEVSKKNDPLYGDYLVFNKDTVEEEKINQNKKSLLEQKASGLNSESSLKKNSSTIK